MAQLVGVIEYTNYIFIEEYESPNKCSGYDTKQSDGEASVMLELWGMWSTPSLPLLSGSFWSGVGAPDRVLSMDQIELNCYHTKLNCLKFTVFPFNCISKKLCTYAKLNHLKKNCFDI